MFSPRKDSFDAIRVIDKKVLEHLMGLRRRLQPRKLCSKVRDDKGEINKSNLELASRRRAASHQYGSRALLYCSDGMSTSRLARQGRKRNSCSQ